MRDKLRELIASLRKQANYSMKHSIDREAHVAAAAELVCADTLEVLLAAPEHAGKIRLTDEGIKLLHEIIERERKENPEGIAQIEAILGPLAQPAKEKFGPSAEAAARMEPAHRMPVAASGEQTREVPAREQFVKDADVKWPLTDAPSQSETPVCGAPFRTWGICELPEGHSGNHAGDFAPAPAAEAGTFDLQLFYGR